MDTSLDVKEKTNHPIYQLKKDVKRPLDSGTPPSSLAFTKVRRYLPVDTIQQLLYIDLALESKKKSRSSFSTIWKRTTNKKYILLHERHSNQISELMQILWNTSQKQALHCDKNSVAYTFFITGQEITRYIASEKPISTQFKQLAKKFADEAIQFAQAIEEDTISE